MSASSPNTVVGDTASTVMGLSPQAASVVQRLDSSIIDSLQQAIERHTGDNGRFLRIADRHLSQFKGLLLARSDNQPGSPPNFPSSTVPGADPVAEVRTAEESPDQSLGASLSSPIRALFSSSQGNPVNGPPADDNIDAVEDLPGSSGAQTIDDTAILDFNLPADLFASAGRSFVSEILTTLSPAILDRLSNIVTMSKNERIRHQLESWKTKTTADLQSIIEHLNSQDEARDQYLEDISESQLNLSQLSLSGADHDDNDVVAESANIQRLQAALKSSEAILQHAHRSIVKSLNSGQQFLVFSQQIKSGSLSAAKTTDYGTKLDDAALKEAGSVSQLITLLSVVKGLISTFPTEVFCIIPTLLQIIEEREMDDRTIPSMLADEESYHAIAHGSCPDQFPSTEFWRMFKQHNAALYDVLFRFIPQTLLSTHRPYKLPSSELVRSESGDFIASLFIIMSKFKKSSFTLRSKYAEIFNCAYQKIQVVADIAAALTHLQGFLLGGLSPNGFLRAQAQGFNWCADVAVARGGCAAIYRGAQRPRITHVLLYGPKVHYQKMSRAPRF